MTDAGKLTIVIACHAKWYNAEAFYALSMARLLLRANHRVLMCLQTASPLVSRAKAASIPFFDVDLLTADPRRLVASLRQFRRQLRQSPPDIITAHRPESLFWSLFSRTALKPLPPIVRFRGDPRPPRAGVLNTWLYGTGCAHVVLSGHHLLRQLQSKLHLPPEHVSVVHAPVDTERFAPVETTPARRDAWRLPSRGQLLGVVGRIGKVKGHRFFLDMLQALSAPDRSVHSFIAYHEEHAGVEELRRDIHRRGLDTHITLVGPSEKIEHLIALADIGVISSVGSEANCRAALEFMSCGVPLVATSVGVIPEVVLEGTTGYLLPPAEPHLAAAKVKLLLEDDDRRRQMGIAARQRAKDFFSEEVFTRNVEEILLSLVRSPRREGQ